MKKSIENMVFVGLNGRVVALDRDSGEVLWQWQATKFGQQHMTLLPDRDRLIVSAGGYIYCLDPQTGGEHWHNPLTGFGIGVATLATIRSHSTHSEAVAAAAD
jgi:outer membrane protein assembly factor BamB